jgi:hypothetical protein
LPFRVLPGPGNGKQKSVKFMSLTESCLKFSKELLTT